MRTDNDISKIRDQDRWQYAGMNRCLKLAEQEPCEHSDRNISPQETIDNGGWQRVSDSVNGNGIYLSKIDLESDLVCELSAPILATLNKRSQSSAIDYLQKKKALRMRELLKGIKADLKQLSTGELAKPLHKLLAISKAV